METVTHHGRRTAYEARGDGPGVLFVHGSGGSRDAWKSQHRLDAHTVALDLSGHGESDDVEADPGYGALSAYAADVVAVAEAVDARVLVGNSLGGAVTFEVLRAHDLDLDGVVFAGTGAKLAVLDDLLEWLDDDADFERVVDFLHGEDRFFHDPDERLLEASRAAMFAAGREVTRRDFRTCHAFDVRDELGGFALPTLALVGEHDQLTPVRYHEYLRDGLPDCDLGVIEEAAHLAMLEQPVAFNAALSVFLDRVARKD